MSLAAAKHVTQSGALIALPFLEHSPQSAQLSGQRRLHAELQRVDLSSGFSERVAQTPNELLLGERLDDELDQPLELERGLCRRRAYRRLPRFRGRSAFAGWGCVKRPRARRCPKSGVCSSSTVISRPGHA